MLLFLTLFFGGMLAGILTSLPMGPTNLWLLRAALPPSKPAREISLFVFGLIFFDFVYAFLAFWGYSTWFASSEYAGCLTGAAAVGLSVIGAHGISKALRDEQAADTGSSLSRRLGPFAAGLILGSNPAFIAYWIVVARITADIAPRAMERGIYVLFSGMLIGDLIWYTAFVTLTKRYLRAVSPQFARFSALGIGALFLLAGGAVLLEAF